MPNIVTPQISTSAELWFDPSGGTEQPTRIDFSMTQTDGVTAPYPGGGTITRSREGIDLYLDSACTQKLQFSENQARLTPAQLRTQDFGGGRTGITCYMKGIVASGIVPIRLTLVLDLLETSERKQTDFTTGTKSNRINVIQNDAGASKDITVKAAAVLTPKVLIGNTEPFDPRVYPSGAPTAVTFTYERTDNDSTAAYNGTGELSLSPKDASIQLYTDASCTTKLVVTDGKAVIPSSNLAPNAPLPFFMKAAPDVSPATVILTLSLKPNSDPKQVVPAGTAARQVSLVPVNTVTPRVVLGLPREHDGALWFPSLVGTSPRVLLSIDQTPGKVLPYKGAAVLQRGSPSLQLFWNEDRTRPVAFFDNQAVIPNALLTAGKPLELYLAGTAPGDVTLGLSLHDAKDRAFALAPPASVTVPIKAANFIGRTLAAQGTVAPGRLTPVKVAITQSNASAPYGQDGTLVRGDVRLLVYAALDGTGKGKDPLFADKKLEAPISNTDLKAGKTFYLTWDGALDKEASLALELPAPNKPYLIIQPSSQLEPETATSAVPVFVEASNTVTPVIDTEYDLVLLDTSSEAKNRTTPVRARFYVTQSAPTTPYTCDGELKRDNGNVRVYLDEACTLELNFRDDKALIPNAALIDPARVYYLRGVASGKSTLTLKAKAPEPSVSTPAITVASEAKRELAVIPLKLTVYRDDGGTSPITEVAMSPRAMRQEGRSLHVQNVQKQYGRARLVLKKVDTSTWPAAAASYQVLVSVVSTQDRLTLHDSEAGTTVAADKDRPLALGKTDVGASDKSYWAEGKAVSADLCDVRVELGLRRDDRVGESWQDRQPSLRNGDWAAMTVVKIVRVTPDVDGWTQYVNQPPDRSLLANDNGNPSKNGRNVLVTAEVEPAKAGIDVDFMLWGFNGNGNAAVGTPRVPNVPDELKAADKHVTAATGSDGKASARIKLSRYGGDRFYAVAFLADDARKGETELGAKGDTAPATTRSKPLEVWQKIFYTLAVMRRHAGGDYTNRANEPTFINKYAGSFLEMERKGNVLIVPHTGVITKANATGAWWTGNGLPASTERTFDLVLMDTIASGAPTPKRIEITAPTLVMVSKVLNDPYDLSAKANWLVAGSGKVLALDNSVINAIPDDRVSLTYEGEASFKLKINIFDLLGGRALDQVKVQVTLRKQTIVSGFSSGSKTFVGIRNREQKAATLAGYDATASANHTMWHETGHYLGLTANKVPNQGQNGNVHWYLGRNNQTRYNSRNPPPPDKVSEVAPPYGAQIGTGNHCRSAVENFAAAQLDTGQLVDVGVSPSCIMYHSLSTPITVNYCPNCGQALRARDLSVPKVVGDTDF
ncbi:hypothetical protein [Archangium lipolyticum]|uniref:hypothetical protein n=1 Tax=Archangium lipolyticum TaxID=2970465 RepID=UPI00214A8932|nr:hypothetical protein [Archangium lipolyticum]